MEEATGVRGGTTEIERERSYAAMPARHPNITACPMVGAGDLLFATCPMVGAGDLLFATVVGRGGAFCGVRASLLCLANGFSLAAAAATPLELGGWFSSLKLGTASISTRLRCVVGDIVNGHWVTGAPNKWPAGETPAVAACAASVKKTPSFRSAVFLAPSSPNVELSFGAFFNALFGTIRLP
jgi:hypothetical protein